MGKILPCNELSAFGTLYGIVENQEQLHSHLIFDLKAKQDCLAFLCQQLEKDFETLMCLRSKIIILSHYFAQKYFNIFCVLLYPNEQGRLRTVTLWHCSLSDPQTAIKPCVLWHTTQPTRLSDSQTATENGLSDSTQGQRSS